MTKTATDTTAAATANSATKFGRIMTAEGSKLYFDETKLRLIAGLLKAGKPVALIGEPGSGKSELARAILYQALNAHAKELAQTDSSIVPQEYARAHFFQQEFAGIVSGDVLDGEKSIGDGGKLEIIPSEHLKAARLAAQGQKVGELLDELNRGAPQGTNKLLRQFAPPYEYSSDLDGILKFEPKNLMAIATLNVGFGFTGTTRSDAALIDRFYPILLTPPPAVVLKDILTDRYDGKLNTSSETGILNAYEKSRASEDSYKLGVRDALMLADGILEGGLTLRQSVEILVGGKVQMNGLDVSSMESLITVVSAV